MHKSRSKLSRKRGKILVLAAFFMVVMCVFLALSVDVGYIYSVKARLQNAADAAACAGAIALPEGADQSRTAAAEYAVHNRAYEEEFTMQTEDVVLGQWDETTATFTALPAEEEEDANAVRVFCRRTTARGNPVGLFFARIMGNQFADVVTTATARIKTSQCGMVVGLDQVAFSGTTYVDSYRSDDGSYFPGTARQKGHVCSNGNIILSQSSAINGDAHPGVGGEVEDYSVLGVTGSSAPLTEELFYPAVDVSEAQASNNNGSIPLLPTGANPVMPGPQLIINGPYHIDIPAGTYYFTRVVLAGGATIGVNGETIMYVNGDIMLSGASILNNTGLAKNLQLYSTGANVVLSGTAAMYGVVYAPNATVSRSGVTDYYGSIISKRIVVSGMGGLHVDESLDLDFLDSGILRTALVD